MNFYKFYFDINSISDKQFIAYGNYQTFETSIKQYHTDNELVYSKLHYAPETQTPFNIYSANFGTS